MADMLQADVVIVGGGLAGLTAANVLSDDGARVAVVEGSEIGGRSRTDERLGMLFNRGPRAFYLDGPGLSTLQELGIDPPGGTPSSDGSVGVIDGRVGLLPGNALTLVRTPLLSARAKLELARFLARLPKVDCGQLAGESTAAWLAARLRHRDALDLISGLTRVSTYVADLERLSVDVGVGQLQMAFGGVRYVDRGWASVASALRNRAEQGGVSFQVGAVASPIEPASASWSVPVGDVALNAPVVLMAGLAPRAAARLSGSPVLAAHAESATPVMAACLDVGLSALPLPNRRFAFGIDGPFYFSVHNPPADLGDGVVLHVMKYLSTADTADRTEVEEELNRFLDCVQPGWRDHVVTSRFLHSMTVVHDIATVDRGGLGGRCPHEIADRPGVYVSGDWVGPIGHLADAAIAGSARIARRLGRQVVPV